MRSVVTGGGGFLGSHIARELKARGDEVLVLGRNRYPELEAEGIECAVADVRDPGALETHIRGADRVFHAAAAVGVWGDEREFYKINVTGTRNVLRACRRTGVTRLVFTSSPSVVFDGTDQRGVDESYPYPERFLSPYPRTKRLAEQLVLEANGPNFCTTALRPHLIWGKGDRFLIPRVIAQARAGKLKRVGHGHNRVDITHVRDAARAHADVASRLGPGGACNGKVYFLSQGEPVRLWDFIDECVRRAGAPPIRGALPFSVAYGLGAALEAAYRIKGGEPPMTRFLAHQLAKDHFYAIDAARRDFGYEPRVSAREGLDELFGSPAQADEGHRSADDRQRHQ